MSISDQCTIEIDKYIDYFKKNTSQPNILAKLFKTDSAYYVYDTGTNKVLSCGEYEYNILGKIIDGKVDEISRIKSDVDKGGFYEALENVRQAIEEEDILKGGNKWKFVSKGHFEELDEKIDHELEQITLELTEKCNLRCRYCIYNESYEHKRNFGNKDMPIEIAEKAIDYANLHSGKEKGVGITFYGGEPLMNFKLLKHSIEYSRKVINDKKLTFSLTSNLTLMTSEIATYLASIENLTILCSIDGPEEIHDSYRKDVNGNGTFKRAIRGLKYLIEAFGDRANKSVSINMVFTPPYSIEKVNKIEAFINSLDWLPKDLRIAMTYPSAGSVDDIPPKGREKNYGMELIQWSESRYKSELKSDGKIDMFNEEFVVHPILRIHGRRISAKSESGYPVNGCCVPGSRKLYVTVDGNFLLCERIDGSPIIGNVFTGMNKAKIKKEIVEEFTNEAIKDCSKCWAARLCNICYSQCYTDGKLDMEQKKRYCIRSRKTALRSLIFYHKCAEINPEKLKYLNEIEVS
ncbi:radical SAM protein [Clostridium felsineum]|uniref:radical SAM protein n=1 Tax=Clostridium felsineum TaxID=36839 RepID=UPI00098C8C3C|nr:radical SAM protein [Clostridium felsineum]URZ17657.1 GTP 3',8-cyclase [Clostridium felsineum DSM 794]